MSQKPSAIIFGWSFAVSLSSDHALVTASSETSFIPLLGGLNTCSRALAGFLVPLEGEALVSVGIRFRSLALILSSHRVL